MDFKWVVDALRRGLKVTRKVWAGEPLYIELTAPRSNSIIAVGGDTQVENWLCLNADILATDWEEYVEPKKDIKLRSVTGEAIKVTPEEMHLWPGVTADGYARMSKDSDVVIHDGVYRPKKEKRVHQDDTLCFDSICKGCFNCIWRKRGRLTVAVIRIS